MRTIAIVLFLLFCCARISAQYFQGTVTYAVHVKSKAGDPFLDKLYGLELRGGAENKTVTYAGDNFKITAGVIEVYSDAAKKRFCYKFKKIDTLYYLGFADDTTSIRSIDKSDPETVIAGYPCKSAVFHQGNGTVSYLYSDKVIGNPAYQKDNKIARTDKLYEEMNGAVYLYAQESLQDYTTTETCTSVKPGNPDPSEVRLPVLPEMPLRSAHLLVPPVFPGGPAAWMAYMQKNLNGNLAEQFVPLKKKEKSASIQVMVDFTIGADGAVTDVHPDSREGIPPQLINEAMRVIKKSPPWTAGTIYGEPTALKTKQPVSFAIERGK